MTHLPLIRTAFLATCLAALAALSACDKPAETEVTMPPPSEPSATPSSSLGSQVDDAVVTSAVKSALLSDDLVKGFDLQVETRNGVVQLSGFVDSQAQIDQALSVARGVAGVTAVENSMSLKSGPTTLGTDVEDATITGMVKAALLADPGVKSFDISVETVEGVVQLTGFVNSQEQIDKAGQLAREVKGVSSVKNELMIKQ